MSIIKLYDFIGEVELFFYGREGEFNVLTKITAHNSINLFSTNIPYMEHHFHELILAQCSLIFAIINALLH